MTNKRVIIVTGASPGLGAAVACWLGITGAGVTLMARSGEKLRRIAKEVNRLGGESLIYVADVSDPKACCNAVQKTLDRFRRLDALVNNAGIVQPIASIAQADPDRWRYNVDVNFIGPFYLINVSIYLSNSAMRFACWATRFIHSVSSFKCISAN